MVREKEKELWEFRFFLDTTGQNEFDTYLLSSHTF